MPLWGAGDGPAAEGAVSGNATGNLARLNAFIPGGMEHLRILSDFAGVGMDNIEMGLRRMSEETEPFWREERWESIFADLDRMQNSFRGCLECTNALMQVVAAVRNSPDDDLEALTEAFQAYNAARARQRQRHEEWQQREEERRRRFWGNFP